MQVNPYVVFNGNCAEALAFYEKAFNGKIGMISRYKDAPAAEGYVTPPEVGELILHAQLDIGGAVIMFCDTSPHLPYNVGNNIMLSVAFDSEDATKAAFAGLKDGGTVVMEMQETFWSKCFGMVTDKYGVTWQTTVVGRAHVTHK
ncbi:MAG: VOC family protein [Defluviitaleaceae bacterium]|nr:VOC family protein [Defluviitaleaceae bacterium]